LGHFIAIFLEIWLHFWNLLRITFGDVIGYFFHKNGGKFPQKNDGFHPEKNSCNFLKFLHFKQIISNFFEFSKNNLITAKLEKLL
jgi:hypothetical protein